jgi:hypothetical protein
MNAEMSTFKEYLYDICKKVAAEFPGWNFTAGQFKNKSLKHTDLLVSLGFAFENGRTPLGPAVRIENKKSMKLHKNLLGFSGATSFLTFQDLANELIYMPEVVRENAWIDQNKKTFLAYVTSINKAYLADTTIDMTEAKPVLHAVMRDGVSLIRKYYDLSSEENLLKAMPPKYTPKKSFSGSYDVYERQKGVMMCIVRLVLGDFEFVERYRSDEYQTVYPKRTVELDKVIAALPELKKRYAETGSVI